MHEEPGFFAEPRNWVVLAFFLFFILFGKKLWGALAGMLDARAASVRAELDEAARLKNEAQAMLKEAEAARVKARGGCEAADRRCGGRGGPGRRGVACRDRSGSETP